MLGGIYKCPPTFVQMSCHIYKCALFIRACMVLAQTAPHSNNNIITENVTQGTCTQNEFYIGV